MNVEESCKVVEYCTLIVAEIVLIQKETPVSSDCGESAANIIKCA